VAIGDLNGDGKSDLATANLGNMSGLSTVSVLLGNSDGSFGVTTDYGTGDFPLCVAIGDLNRDGKPDLVTANSGTYPDYAGTVSVLLGHGDGSFGAKTDYSTGSSPSSVAIGDLNGDGRLDLAVANNESNTVSVLLGNGAGGFGPKTDIPAGGSPYSVAIGDLNGDGLADLAVGHDGREPIVSVLLGNGDGTFGPRFDYGTEPYTVSVAIGDLNGDGRPDLVAANFYTNDVQVFRNTGGLPAAVDSVANKPQSFRLFPPSPNPFRGRVRLDFALPQASRVEVAVFDATGRLVERLVNGRTFSAGRHSLLWDAQRRSSARLPSGVYFVRITAGPRALTGKVVLISR